MIPFVWILIIIIFCLFSSIFIYLLIQSRENFKTTENQRVKYTIQPSIDIITKKLPYRLSISSRRRSSNLENNNPIRSNSLANTLFINKHPHRRQSSIIDSKQISQIEFSLPPTADKFRRRSVAICNNIIESSPHTINSLIKTIKSSNELFPCLITFSINYINSSQIQIDFESLAFRIALQQLTIKIKLIPDGKTKYIEIKKIQENENIFQNDNKEYRIQFSNISFGKLHEKALVMKFYGKDQAKKAIQFGQVGKIHFNQLKDLHDENSLGFIHEIECIKLSSMEILVSLEHNNDHNLIVDIQRIKGIKVDQKNSVGTCFFKIILLDRHRPLSTHQTKSYRLNSSTFSLREPFPFNILAFNSNNLDRIMIMIKFYTNTINPIEHQCIARVKLASHLFCSGTGTIHWQQFKERQSFSMWHTLIKQ